MSSSFSLVKAIDFSKPEMYKDLPKKKKEKIVSLLKQVFLDFQEERDKVEKKKGKIDIDAIEFNYKDQKVDIVELAILLDDKVLLDLAYVMNYNFSVKKFKCDGMKRLANPLQFALRHNFFDNSNLGKDFMNKLVQYTPSFDCKQLYDKSKLYPRTRQIDSKLRKKLY